MKNIIGVLNKIVKEKLDALDKMVILRNYHRISKHSMERMKMSISKTIKKTPRCSKNKYHPCDGSIWTKRGRFG